MKNKILYVGRFNLPSGSASAQRVNINKKALEALGYEVIFVSTFETEGISVGYEKDTNINEIPLKDFFISFSYLKKIIKRNGSNSIHSVIFYNFPSIPLLSAKRYLNQLNIRTYADITEWYGIPPKSNLIKKIIKTIDSEYRMRRVHKKLDGLICISEYLAEYYKSHTNVILIPNLVDVKDDKWKNETTIGDNHKKNRMILLYAGSPGANFEKESLDYIVKSFSEVLKSKPNMLLKIVGIESSYFEEIYFRKYKSRPNLESIEFLGRKSHLEVIQETKLSDYFIFIRPYTKANKAGFPTKLVEALSAGTPVIANDVGDIGKYLKNGVNGHLIGKDEEKDLMKILLDIVNEPEKVNEMKGNILEKNLFQYESYLQQFKEFLKKEMR